MQCFSCEDLLLSGLKEKNFRRTEEEKGVPKRTSQKTDFDLLILSSLLLIRWSQLESSGFL